MSKRVFGSMASERKGPRYTSGAREFQVSEDIVPIAQLKANLSEVVRGLDERARPLVVTLNGNAAAVLMSPREYDRLTYRARLLQGISEGFGDVEAGRVISDDEFGKRMEQRYSGGPKPRRR